MPTGSRGRVRATASTRRCGRSACRSSRGLEECRLALADADAEGSDPVAAAAPTQLVDERDDEAGAAHPERVADGDGAAVDVDALVVEAELAHHDKALR